MILSVTWRQYCFEVFGFSLSILFGPIFSFENQCLFLENIIVLRRMSCWIVVKEQNKMVGLANVFLLFALQISFAKSSLTHRKIVKNCQKVFPTDIPVPVCGLVTYPQGSRALFQHTTHKKCPFLMGRFEFQPPPHVSAISSPKNDFETEPAFLQYLKSVAKNHRWF